MAYFVIEDFMTGLDARRLPQATPPQALVTLENAVINRGGEIEKAKKFSTFTTINAGSYGLLGASNSLYIFGSVADPGGYTGLSYKRLQHEGGQAMSKWLNGDLFAGTVFATAEYADGSRRAFNNTTIVAGLQSGSGTDFAGLVIGNAALTYKNKMYLTSGTDLLFSKSGAADIFDQTQTGSGLIDQSVHVSDAADIVGLGSYQNYLAVLADQNIAIWQADPDPAAYELVQVLPNMGALSAKSVKSFGEHDLFFVSNTGIRSLRAINSSLAAGITDVGTPIDPLVIAKLASMTAVDKAVIPGEIEPSDGRYFAALGDTIYAFSYFPASRVSAWSTIKPGFSITDFARANGKLYARSGDTIYLYGGTNNNEYTDQEVVVETPYLDARTLATAKYWTAIGAVCEGRWNVYINTEVTRPDYWPATPAAVLNGHTTSAKMIGIDHNSPILKMKFVHQGEGPAVLSKLILHYERDRGA